MGSIPGIRVLCQRRWTVHAESVHRILTNYKTLQRTWEEALEVTPDTKAKSRIQGVAAQMTTFTHFFGSMHGELVLKHMDNLSRTLQHASKLAAEGQHITAMMVATRNSMHSDDQFNLFGI